jgi:hypothetical protein
MEADQEVLKAKMKTSHEELMAIMKVGWEEIGAKMEACSEELEANQWCSTWSSWRTDIWEEKTDTARMQQQHERPRHEIAAVSVKQ